MPRSNWKARLGRKLRAWPRRVAIAADQFVNAVFLGDEDETISSRLAKGRLAGRWWGVAGAAAVDWVFLALFRQADHCNKSLEADEGCQRIRAELAARLARAPQPSNPGVPASTPG